MAVPHDLARQAVRTLSRSRIVLGDGEKDQDPTSTEGSTRRCRKTLHVGFDTSLRESELNSRSIPYLRYLLMKKCHNVMSGLDHNAELLRVQTLYGEALPRMEMNKILMESGFTLQQTLDERKWFCKTLAEQEVTEKDIGRVSMQDMIPYKPKAGQTVRNPKDRIEAVNADMEMSQPAVEDEYIPEGQKSSKAHKSTTVEAMKALQNLYDAKGALLFYHAEAGVYARIKNIEDAQKPEEDGIILANLLKRLLKDDKKIYRDALNCIFMHDAFLKYVINGMDKNKLKEIEVLSSHVVIPNRFLKDVILPFIMTFVQKHCQPIQEQIKKLVLTLGVSNKFHKFITKHPHGTIKLVIKNALEKSTKLAEMRTNLDAKIHEFDRLIEDSPCIDQEQRTCMATTMRIMGWIDDDTYLKFVNKILEETQPNAGTGTDQDADAGMAADQDADAGMAADQDADAGMGADQDAGAGMGAGQDANPGMGAGQDANPGMRTGQDANPGMRTGQHANPGMRTDQRETPQQIRIKSLQRLRDYMTQNTECTVMEAEKKISISVQEIMHEIMSRSEREALMPYTAGLWEEARISEVHKTLHDLPNTSTKVGELINKLKTDPRFAEELTIKARTSLPQFRWNITLSLQTGQKHYPDGTDEDAKEIFNMALEFAQEYVSRELSRIIDRTPNAHWIRDYIAKFMIGNMMETLTDSGEIDGTKVFTASRLVFECSSIKFKHGEDDLHAEDIARHRWFKAVFALTVQNLPELEDAVLKKYQARDIEKVYRFLIKELRNEYAINSLFTDDTDKIAFHKTIKSLVWTVAYSKGMRSDFMDLIPESDLLVGIDTIVIEEPSSKAQRKGKGSNPAKIRKIQKSEHSFLTEYFMSEVQKLLRTDEKQQKIMEDCIRIIVKTYPLRYVSGKGLLNYPLGTDLSWREDMKFPSVIADFHNHFMTTKHAKKTDKIFQSFIFQTAHYCAKRIFGCSRIPETLSFHAFNATFS